MQVGDTIIVRIKNAEPADYFPAERGWFPAKLLYKEDEGDWHARIIKPGSEWDKWLITIDESADVFKPT